MSPEVLGLIMIAAGILLVLAQLGTVEIGSLGAWWPLLLVLFGIVKATGPRPERDLPEGAMLVLLGGWMLCVVHHWYGLTWRNSWPLIFVALGAKTVLRALAPRAPKSGATEVREDLHA